MTDLSGVHVQIADALGELSKLFKPGMKLTFIARQPDHAERYIVVGDDDPAALAAFLAAAWAADKPTGGG